jgi:hypothetical protein
MGTYTEDTALCFTDSFEDSNFSEVESLELKLINDALDEIKAANLLQKGALSELSEYHKALKVELKERKADFF